MDIAPDFRLHLCNLCVIDIPVAEQFASNQKPTPPVNAIQSAFNLQVSTQFEPLPGPLEDQGTSNYTSNRLQVVAIIDHERPSASKFFTDERESLQV
jgi:hypothetical protein